MSSRKGDPLDVGQPGQKEWEEFRSRYGAVLLLRWLLSDIEMLRPKYVGELWQRLESAEIDFDKLPEEGTDSTDLVPITGPDWPEDLRIVSMLSRAELAVLASQLFPHGRREASLQQVGRAAVLVALHSALESYAAVVGAHTHGNLARNLKAFVQRRGESSALAAATADALTNADATRHVVVHRAGIVDQAYLRQAVDSRFEVGEHRLISQEEIDTWARAIFAVARLLQRIVTQPPIA